MKNIFGILILILTPITAWAVGGAGGNDFLRYKHPVHGYSIQYPVSWELVETSSSETEFNSLPSSLPTPDGSFLKITVVDGYQGSPEEYGRDFLCGTCDWLRASVNNLVGVNHTGQWTSGPYGLRREMLAVLQFSGKLLVLKAEVSTSRGGARIVSLMIESLKEDSQLGKQESSIDWARIDSPQSTVGGAVQIRLKGITDLGGSGKVVGHFADLDSRMEFRLRGSLQPSGHPMEYTGGLPLGLIPAGTYKLVSLRLESEVGTFHPQGGYWVEVLDPSRRSLPFALWTITNPSKVIEVRVGEVAKIPFATNFQANDFISEGSWPLTWESPQNFSVEIPIPETLPEGEYKIQIAGMERIFVNYKLFQFPGLIAEPFNGPVVVGYRDLKIKVVNPNRLDSPLKIVGISGPRAQVRCGDDVELQVEFNHSPDKVSVFLPDSARNLQSGLAVRLPIKTQVDGNFLRLWAGSSCFSTRPIGPTDMELRDLKSHQRIKVTLWKNKVWAEGSTINYFDAFGEFGTFDVFNFPQANPVYLVSPIEW